MPDRSICDVVVVVDAVGLAASGPAVAEPFYRPFEGVFGRHHHPADDFPCPTHRGSKPVLDKSVSVCPVNSRNAEEDLP